MTLDDMLAQVLDLLQRQGRVSYRALKRRFALDDDYLEDLKAEIIKAQRLAVDEDGDVLVSTGDAGRSPAPANAPVRAPHAWMAEALGAAYTLGGRVADAVPLLTQAMGQTMATETVGDQTLCSLPLGEAQVLAGRLEEAHALAEHTLALAREHQQGDTHAYALRLLSKIESKRWR
jgi:hypothetical protein